MRLSILENSQRLQQKVLLFVIGLVLRHPAPDVLRTLLYRREFFGRKFSARTQTVLRRSHESTAGESELFAAFVSRKNQCLF